MMMRNTELDEIRALLRSQAVVGPAPSRRGLFDGLKTLLKGVPDAGGYRPLSPAIRTDGGASARSHGSEPLMMTLTAEDHVPLLFLAPRRERFGLADESPRSEAVEAEPVLALRPLEETPDDIEPLRVEASLAARETAEAGVGPGEILELQALLAARMPGLLSHIDLEAKLDEGAGDAPQALDPAAADAARAEAAEAQAAWAEAGAQLQARAHENDPLPGPRLRLVALEADMAAHHADLADKLAGVRRGRRRRALAA